MQLNDPDYRESVPAVDGDFPPAPSDPMTPAPLSRTALIFLKRSVAQHQRRRRLHRAGRLRLCIDGEERWQCDPGVGVCGPFSVPLGASHLEVFWEDNEGALLLAVFPLPEPKLVEDERGQDMFVTVEGGQIVAIKISLGDSLDGEVREYVLHLTYVESTAVDTQGPEHP
jgi:hypothetical protein